MEMATDRRISPFGIPQRYLTVFLTFLCTSVCYIERVGFSLAYTSTAIQSGVDQTTKGWVLSAFYYGYASSQVPGGWAAQKLGGRRVLLYSFLLWSVVCLLTPTEPGSIFFLIIIRLLVGIVQGFIFPSIHTVLAQWIPPHERSRSVSLTTSGMYFGAAVAMLFLPNLIAFRGPNSVFQLVSALGLSWAILWAKTATDPPGGVLGFPPPTTSDRNFRYIPVSTVEENGDGPIKELPVKSKAELEERKNRHVFKSQGIPWWTMLTCLPIWAIVVNNFTFHYVLYVLMNWLPTYFDQGLQASLHSMGFSKMLPYFVMFLFSNVGGVIADHLITKRIFSVTITRKLLNTLGFMASAIALMMMPILNSVFGTILCASVTLGACALSRAGFAVNHMDIAPRYAGIVMGLSNTAGTVAGVVGVATTGFILEAYGKGVESQDAAWRLVFATPALLCVVSAVIFCVFSTGERLFD